MQLPAPVSVTVLPAMAQGPVALKLTARPELTVALTENGGSPTAWPARGAKMMVWGAEAIANVWATGAAAA